MFKKLSKRARFYLKTIKETNLFLRCVHEVSKNEGDHYSYDRDCSGCR